MHYFIQDTLSALILFNLPTPNTTLPNPHLFLLMIISSRPRVNRNHCSSSPWSICCLCYHRSLHCSPTILLVWPERHGSFLASIQFISSRYFILSISDSSVKHHLYAQLFFSFCAPDFSQTVSHLDYCNSFLSFLTILALNMIVFSRFLTLLLVLFLKYLDSPIFHLFSNPYIHYKLISITYITLQSRKPSYLHHVLHLQSDTYIRSSTILSVLDAPQFPLDSK